MSFGVMDRWMRALGEHPLLLDCEGASSCVYLLVVGGEIRVAKWYRNDSVDAARMCEREIACLRELSHPNIVRMYGVTALEKRHVVLLEYMAGGNLFEWIAAISPDEAEARAVIAQLISGIAAIHEAGYIHRDIKCDNVLLDDAESRHPTAKIADFGLSKKSPSKMPFSGRCCGSLEYLAPELLRAEPYDERVDVWSFGVTCYATLTGNFPFGGGTTRAVVEAIVAGDATWSGIPSAASREFVESCLRLEISERPSSSELLRHAWLAEKRSAIEADDARPERRPVRRYCVNCKTL